MTFGALAKFLSRLGDRFIHLFGIYVSLLYDVLACRAIIVAICAARVFCVGTAAAL